jgi:hypothetical protein
MPLIETLTITLAAGALGLLGVFLWRRRATPHEHGGSVSMRSSGGAAPGGGLAGPRAEAGARDADAVRPPARGDCRPAAVPAPG